MRRTSWDMPIVVEESLCDERGEAPTDYKFFCFDGVPKIIDVVERRFSGSKFSDSYFDMNWKQYDVSWSDWPGEEGYPAGSPTKPENFDELIRVASKLSKPFDFVRVDLYSISGRIYFGEFTHYPSAGIAEIEPQSFNDLLGSFWALPDKRFLND
jgi:hypothetical protein